MAVYSIIPYFAIRVARSSVVGMASRKVSFEFFEEGENQPAQQLLYYIDIAKAFNYFTIKQ